MKFTPILFSTEMVQAILAGRKTQTRRILKVKGCKPFIPDSSWDIESILEWNKNYHPYGQVGDVLWVRETFCEPILFDGNEKDFYYKADSPDSCTIEFKHIHGSKWRPGIHMPKYACRLFLKIKSIRVERVNEISKKDAVLEGIRYDSQFKKYNCYLCGKPNGFHIGATNICNDGFYSNPIDSFASLWSSINSQTSWQIGIWVWVIEFERIEKPENF